MEKKGELDGWQWQEQIFQMRIPEREIDSPVMLCGLIWWSVFHPQCSPVSSSLSIKCEKRKDVCSMGLWLIICEVMSVVQRQARLTQPYNRVIKWNIAQHSTAHTVQSRVMQGKVMRWSIRQHRSREVYNGYDVMWDDVIRCIEGNKEENNCDCYSVQSNR